MSDEIVKQEGLWDTLRPQLVCLGAWTVSVVAFTLAAIFATIMATLIAMICSMAIVGALQIQTSSPVAELLLMWLPLLLVSTGVVLIALSWVYAKVWSVLSQWRERVIQAWSW